MASVATAPPAPSQARKRTKSKQPDAPLKLACVADASVADASSASTTTTTKKKTKKALEASAASIQAPQVAAPPEGFLLLHSARIVGIEGGPSVVQKGAFWEHFATLSVEHQASLVDEIHSAPHVYVLEGTATAGDATTPKQTIRVGPTILPVFASFYKLAMFISATPLAVGQGEPTHAVLPGSVRVENLEEIIPHASSSSVSPSSLGPTLRSLRIHLEAEGLRYASGDIAKSFMIDPLTRYGSIEEMHQAGAMPRSHASVHHLCIGEMFLGRDYFTLSRYFCVEHFFGQSGDRVKRFLAYMRTRSPSELLAKFLSVESTAEQFCGGQGLVNFICEQTTQESATATLLEELVPIHLKAASKEFPSERVAPHTRPLSQGLCLFAGWLDNLRLIYRRLCADYYASDGCVVHADQLNDQEELSYARYLVGKGALLAFSDLGALCGKHQNFTLIEAAVSLAKYGLGEEAAVAIDDIAVSRRYFWMPRASVGNTIQVAATMVSLLLHVYDTSADSHVARCLESAVGRLPTSAGAAKHERPPAYFDRLLALAVESGQPRDVVDKLKTEKARRISLETYEAKNLSDGFGKTPALCASMARVLLSARPVAEREAQFWDTVRSQELAQLAAKSFDYGRRHFGLNYTRNSSSSSSSSLKTSVSSTPSERASVIIDNALRYPVVFFDAPQAGSFSELAFEHSVGAEVQRIARRIATFNLGPAEVIRAHDLSRDRAHLPAEYTGARAGSGLGTRQNSRVRLLVLHEAEKFTMRNIKDALVHAFGSAAETAECLVVWVFADMNALDLGGLSMLWRLTSTRHGLDVPFITMRSCSVRESLLSGIANLVVKGQDDPELQARTDEDLGDALMLTASDIDEVNGEGADGESIQVRLQLVQSNMLPRKRLPQARLPVAKVYLSAIDTWRELYTMTCYATHGLVMVGEKASLMQLLEDSQEDWRYEDVSNESFPNGTLPCDVMVDERGCAMRLTYRAPNRLDLFTAIGMRSATAAASVVIV